MQPVIWVPCRSCAVRFKCHDRGEMHRRCARSWANDETYPDCSGYVQAHFPPRPSTHGTPKRI